MIFTFGVFLASLSEMFCIISNSVIVSYAEGDFCFHGYLSEKISKCINLVAVIARAIIPADAIQVIKPWVQKIA